MPYTVGLPHHRIEILVAVSAYTINVKERDANSKVWSRLGFDGSRLEILIEDLCR
ncbi:hypothetical protein LCGC14_0111740 [marine sediment metagenome]|uniref:Uncharacterized protein n=1 Tax=marine sediment metagenome TaxID=412755 RepID=A0A0F9YBB7_9ZZZZ